MAQLIDKLDKHTTKTQNKRNTPQAHRADTSRALDTGHINDVLDPTVTRINPTKHQLDNVIIPKQFPTVPMENHNINPNHSLYPQPEPTQTPIEINIPQLTKVFK